MADDIPVATAQDSTEGTVALQPAAQQERQRRPSTSQSGQGAVDSRRATPVQAGSRASSPQAELATQTAEHERHAGVTDNGETSTSGAGHLYPQGYG